MPQIHAPMPQIKVNNQLNKQLSIYDSFAAKNDSGKTQDAAYYGNLTLLGTVPANGSTTLTLKHEYFATLIAFDGNNAPLARYQWNMMDSVTPPPFSLSKTDVAIIQLSKTFVLDVMNQPDGELAKNFKAVKKLPGPVDSFFKSNPTYSQCTFVSFMLALTFEAQTPASKPQPPEKKVYSLKKLSDGLSNSPYPPELPDIDVFSFSCQYVNQEIKLDGQVNLAGLTFKNDAVASHILSLFPVKTVDIRIWFDTQVGLNLFGTQLQFIANNFNIPVGDGKTITIQSPSVSLDITPLFKFVVFTARAYIPFSLFGYQFKANISMTIDNVEAEIGAVIDVAHASLPSPSIMQGIHFDEFGVGMGIIFEPPGYALGVQGKFHIGSGSGVVELDDDTFAIICELEDDIPNPVYLSYYVPKLDINTLIDLYTNANVHIDLPIEFKDLSFLWCENLMEPYVLPDGTLCNNGYGFSAYMNLFGLEFYSNVQISMNGIEGSAQLSPIDLFGGLLKIEGHSKDVIVKEDANGTIIKNNQIPTTQAAKQAIANAKSVTLIKGGGAEMSVSTSSQPYLSISSKMSLLDVIKQDISATVDNSGIQFELDFGCIIQTKMNCVLQDYHNFTGSFSYGPDFYVPLSLVGISLGDIHIDITISATLRLSVNESDICFSVGGGFDLEGLTLNFGPYGLDINISDLSDVLSKIEQYIIQEAETIFKDILADAKKWAEWVITGIVSIYENVMNGLKNAYKLAYKDAAQVLHDVGYVAYEVVKGLYEVYGLACRDTTQALHDVGYAAVDFAYLLYHLYGLAYQDLAQVLHDVGYAADDVAHVLSDVSEDLGYAADDVARALSDVYEFSHRDVPQILHDVGYAADDVAHVLRDVYFMAYQYVAQVLYDVGYAVDDVAHGRTHGTLCRAWSRE